MASGRECAILQRLAARVAAEPMKKASRCGGLLRSARLRSAVDDQAFPILNILVLHTGHTPSVAGLPFFIVMAFGVFISLLTLHLRQ